MDPDSTDDISGREQLFSQLRGLALLGDHRGDYFAARDKAADARDALADDNDAIADQLDAVRAEHVAANEADDSSHAALIAIGVGDRARAATARQRARDDRRAAHIDRLAAAFDRSLSTIDGLTGTYRRDAGLGRLAADHAAATRDHAPFTVGFVDGDGLKSINDTLGHATGDRVLRQVAATLAAVLRPQDPLVRYGGDEFVFSITGDHTDIARRIAHVNTILRDTCNATVSFGLATAQPGHTLTDVVSHADADLYDHRRNPTSRA